MNDKHYPDSGVELNPFTAKNYDKVMNIGSVGLYGTFIKRAIRDLAIQPGDHILDLGCGTGRNAGLMLKYLDDTGHITGLDISEHMEKQFRQKFSGEKSNVNTLLIISDAIGRRFSGVMNSTALLKISILKNMSDC